VSADLADDPAHMFLVAYSYITHNPDLALALVGTFVIISQLKIGAQFQSGDCDGRRLCTCRGR
jgi:hypothetical protein